MGRKILISGALSGGGVGTHVTILCDLLLQEDATIHCCATHSQWRKSELERLRGAGVTIHLPPLGRWGALVTWPFAISREFDILYCIGHGRGHTLARPFLRSGGVVIYHEVLVCPPPGGVMDKLMPMMDMIVANSKTVGSEMRTRYPGKPIQVIPFLTAERSVVPPIPRSPVGDRELRVAYLGRLAPHKGAERLVCEWDRLCHCDKFFPARLDVYGDDTDPTTLLRLREWVTRRGVGATVTCHGPYDHARLPEILSQADMVVLPSEWEGLPLVLVEAMQYGVPIVATDVGGSSELGDDNPDVIITPPAWEPFVEGLMRMATRLREDGIDSLRLHRWAETRYGYEAVAPMWRQVFSDRGFPRPLMIHGLR